jgi:hypothetical protein
LVRLKTMAGSPARSAVFLTGGNQTTPAPLQR